MIKAKKITTDKATILVVELPKCITTIQTDISGRICYYTDRWNLLWSEKTSVELLGRLPDITEEQAIGLVDSYEVSHNLDLTATLAFKDYNNGISEDENVDYDYWDEYPFDTAIESLYSLLQSNQIYFENPLGIDRPKLALDDKDYDEFGFVVGEGIEKVKVWEDKYWDWLEAGKKVWDKDRTFLLIKVD